MTKHSVDLDLDTALASPAACPACGSRDLRALSEVGGVVFACVTCRQSWIPELGALLPTAHARPAERVAVPHQRAGDDS